MRVMAPLSGHEHQSFPWRAHLETLRHWVAYIGPARLVGGAATALVICLGGWLLLRPAAASLDSQIPRAVTVSDSAASGSAGPSPVVTAVVASPVKVHVAGAVNNPGVYQLSPGSRVVDAVRAAGGATTRADLERINLAQVVLDTEQIYVPTRQSGHARVTVPPRLRPSRTTRPTPTTTPAQGTTAVPNADSGSTANKKVNLNSATAAQLDELPGVGPATAKAIVTYRSRKGPFVTVEDLLKVSGIGPAKFAAIRDLVSV